jgi:type VI secretion system secreted protein VgrG
MALKQQNRLLNLTTALGTDKLFLASFSGNEEMSHLFNYQLELISDDPGIQAKDLVGTPVGWSVERADNSRRYWHGYINTLVRGDVDASGRREYRAEVVPWLWFLTQTSDCKIFQETKVPDIIDEVLADFGFADYETDFQLEHKDWEYCVQYRETDFNFLSRLMEQEGITYYFKHSDAAHKLILTDHKDGVYDAPESTVDFPGNVSGIAVKDHVTSWEREYQFVSGKYTQRDYNFKTPSTDLKSESSTVVDLPGIQSYEVYDYPGEYPDKAIGQGETKLRIEEEETNFDTVNASSLCKTFQVGSRFKIGQHVDRSEEGNEFSITSIHHSASEPTAYESGADYGEGYKNSFTCIPSNTVYRPERKTPKPLISGIQTAVVTGPSGEEIYPDEFGRVKCQFHWDRYGQKDDKSSCWIRVSQGHAGAGFGGMIIPRIGEEVVISFLEGDPDRPLITGRVYHAENMPHYPLPDHKTRSTLRSRSTKDGDGFNELTFEDLKDEERLYMQAEKDMDVRVKNDSKTRIYGHRHQIIGWEKDGEKGGDQREMVYENKHLSVKGNQIEKIEGNHELFIGGGEDGGKLDLYVEKQRTEKVGEGYDLKVSGDQRTKVDGSVSETVGMDQQTKVGMTQAVEAGQEIHLKAGMKVVIEAGVQLSLVGPGGFVDIGPAGVTIQGIMVKVNSGGAAGSGSGCSPAEPEDPAQAAPTEPSQAWVPDH